MNAHFDSWPKKSAVMLKELKAGCHPKEIIFALSEDLAARTQ
jgi:type I restriction enzyme M protein